MPTIAIDMNLKQIEEVIDKLDSNKKIKLIKDLEKATWPDRFRRLLSRIDRRIKTHPALLFPDFWKNWNRELTVNLKKEEFNLSSCALRW